jgi:hypothetical protein
MIERRKKWVLGGKYYNFKLENAHGVQIEKAFPI